MEEGIPKVVRHVKIESSKWKATKKELGAGFPLL